METIIGFCCNEFRLSLSLTCYSFFDSVPTDQDVWKKYFSYFEIGAALTQSVIVDNMNGTTFFLTDHSVWGIYANLKKSILNCRQCEIA